MWILAAIYRQTQPKLVGLSDGWRPLALSMDSSNEPGEPSHYGFGHDDSTINIIACVLLLLLQLLYGVLWQRLLSWCLSG